MKKYDFSNPSIIPKKNALLRICNLISQINEQCTENLMCYLFGWRKLESKDIEECRHLIDGDE